MGQLLQFFTLVLWLAFVDYSLQAGLAPELNLDTPTVTLLANGTFQVECSGYYPVQWIFPADWRSLISSKAKVNESHHSNRTKPHVSTLTIEDLEYRFTGRYICASTIGLQPDEHNFEEDGSASASIYLYVYDDQHILAPLTNRTSPLVAFSIIAGKTAIIPCRPTRPDATVQLIGYLGEIQDAIFDPRRGFILEHPTVDLEGVAYCKASYENITETQMLFLRFHAETNIVPRPTINDSAARYPVIGQPFTLDCIVHSNEPISVIWMYPEGNDDIEIGNTTVSKVNLHTMERVSRISRKLDVSIATQNHTGFYTCKVITLRQALSQTIYLHVHELPPTPFVNNTDYHSGTDTDALQN